MGNASSTAGTGVDTGPELTPGEKRASANPSTELWLKRLEDRGNPSRSAIFNILSPAVFGSTSMDIMSPNLKGDLLRACNSDPQRLARMIRTPFLDGQSPIAWAICNIPESLFSSSLWEQFLAVLLDTSPGGDKLPPVLAILLDSCPGWDELPSTVDAIHMDCCLRNSNELLQLLNPHSKSPSSTSRSYTLQKGSAGESAFEFVINDFPSCMLVDGKVDLRFVCESHLCSVGFAVRGSKNDWVLFYRVVHDASKNKGYFGEGSWPRYIHIDLYRRDGLGTQIDVFKPPYISRYHVTEEYVSAEILKNGNDFVRTDRSLRGRIRISRT